MARVISPSHASRGSVKEIGMNETQKGLSGPDLAQGVALSKVADGAMHKGSALHKIA